MLPELEAIQQKYIAWATQRDDIRAVILVGSYARPHTSPDNLADLDIETYTIDYMPYLDDAAWIETLGEVWTTLSILRGDGYPEHLVLFEDALKVDFSFLPLSDLENMVNEQKFWQMYERGYEILLDKDGLAAQLPAPTYQISPLNQPEKGEFLREVGAFWYDVAYVAKQLRREQLWMVQARDWTMKQHLLKMLEWHTGCKHGWDTDTWFEGRFIHEWIDPDLYIMLSQSFGHFQVEDGWRALFQTMLLFRKAAQEVAQHLRFDYPQMLDDNIVQVVNKRYAQTK